MTTRLTIARSWLVPALLLILASAVAPGTSVGATTPTMDQLSQAAMGDAFASLNNPLLLGDPDQLHEAALAAFSQRQEEAVIYALHFLRRPRLERDGPQVIDRFSEFEVARAVVDAFPDVAVPILIDTYNTSNATTRGNVIMALGPLAGDNEPAKGLLTEALDDKTVCEELDPESAGEPLRVADVAYNQLVLNLQVQDVLRTIGPSHRVEIRDQHIDILKGRL